MSAPDLPPSAPASERTASDRAASDCAEAARSADLAELLGHTTTCWDEQRRLLARQLHDSLGSSMTALTLHLDLLTQQLPPDKALRARSAQMKTLLADIIKVNRDMQVALWDDRLEFIGVKVAIRELVGEFGKRHQLVARVSLPEQEASYPRQLSVALMRCLEEGVRNIAAHARATEVDVILDDDGEQLMLTVRDNGVGLSAAAFAPGACERHGLRMLRERAVYLGGRLTVAAPPPEVAPRGTVLTLILPLPR
jgi:signal transduction histidine kinase